jgi:F420-dependent oxidoreductase-like protein
LLDTHNDGGTTVAKLAGGLVVPTSTDSGRDLELIQRLDEIGIDTAWQTAGATRPDVMTLYGAAAATTSRIRLGTSIVPTYTRHPAVLATQALVIDSIAPGRLRIGVGPSHRPTIEGSLGIPMGKPLAHLREYVTVLRELLESGRVDFNGDYFEVHLAHQTGTIPPRLEILVSALSANAFRLAGEIADGAISWVAPIPYLVESALPTLNDVATRSGRAAPPIIAHVPVAMTTDRAAAVDATARDFGSYGRLPFYARMFEAAGFPVTRDGQAPPAVIDNLTVSGTSDQVRSRLEAIVAEGIGEVLVSLVPITDATAERHELAMVLAGS